MKRQPRSTIRTPAKALELWRWLQPDNEILTARDQESKASLSAIDSWVSDYIKTEQSEQSS